MTAEVSSGAGGHLLVVAYTWVHGEDGPQDGLLTVGQGAEPGQALALWADSWHQKPAPTTLTGSVTDKTLTLSCTYEGDWQWIITLAATEPDSLIVRMDNVVPPSAGDAVTYWAMNATLQRTTS